MTFDQQKTLVLIDGSSFLYRAYYGTRPLHTSKGTPVNAVYGFCRMIKKLIDTIGSEHIVLVWDSKGKTTRHEMYEDYKATRQAPPSDLFTQKEYIMQFADLIGLKQVAQSGIEADDLLFSLAKEWPNDGSVIVVTTDKDMGQMLSTRVIMYDAFKELFFDEAAFEQKMGFSVHKLPFYFALLGDSSDNIPGVKGIGEKGATDLVQQFDSLETLYANLDAVTSKRSRTALEANKENAYLSLKLFLLQYHPTGLQHDDLLFNRSNWSQARPLFQELEFKSFLTSMESSTSLAEKQAVLAKYTYQAVTQLEQLQAVVAEIEQAGQCALDTETVGLNPLVDDAVGISICTRIGHAYYIPFGHQTGEQQISREAVVATLKPVLEDARYAKYLHNAKFDELVLSRLGIEMRGLKLDTMIVAYLLTKEWQRVGLKWLSLHFFNEPMLDFDDMVTKQKRANFSYVPLQEATLYAAADAHQTFKLVGVLEPMLAAEPTLKKLYVIIERPMIHVLYLMERRGILLDQEVLATVKIEAVKRLAALEAEILVYAGEKYAQINLNSPKQIEQLLFHHLQLPPQKKSAKGTGHSTDQEVLTTLAELHPIAGLILQHRELSKLLSTYIEALPTYINPHTHAIHTTFSQIATATGRLASSQPNVQNIPTENSLYGLAIRSAFKARPGYAFISADYSQIELRVLAHMSGDSALVAAFTGDHDIHAQTAAYLYTVPLTTVTNEQRQLGKRINFSVLYGLTPYGLSKDLHIPLKQAKQYIDEYFKLYAGVSSWMDKIVHDAQISGYVETLYGRRRYIPELHEKNRTLFDAARRIAINTPVQGTAADIMKLGMLRLQHAFEQQNLDAHMLLQIHDELIIEVRTEQLLRTQGLVRHELENVVAWSVPLKVTLRSGATWADVTK
ncbi:DNA polymerase I [Candidatus Dependentiae bacterium]|nr:DNA polymerase I [Candidatus Dependentiae bacterium]MCC7415422.1 DNA polymerase I [Campylobacterota bacterium]